MNAVTLAEAKQNLEQLIEQVVTEQGQRVVFLPLDEFNSWKETLYLLANPANAAHLRRSIAEARTGQTAERELSDV